MYNHILVPVVFGSERNTGKALSVAKLMAGRDGKITLLHVIEQIPGYAISYVPPEFSDETLKSVKTELAAMAAPLRHGNSVVISGHSGRTIVEWAKSHEPDCIIVASHVPVVSDYLLGSTASHIVRHAECSVHVVR